MPGGILPDEGIADQLSYILSSTISGVLPWQLILFTNDLTPDSDTVLADLEEAEWPGYMRKTLTRSDWTTPEVNAGCASSTYGTYPIVWYVGEITTPVTNYGAAFIDQTVGVIRWVQRFDDEDLFEITTGGQYSYLPTYTLTSAQCASMMSLARKKARRNKRKAN